MTAPWTGICWVIRSMPDCKGGYKTSIAFIAASPRYTKWIAIRRVLNGSTVTTPISSTVTLIRKGKSISTIILVICNFTLVPRYSYRLGSPRGGFWQEMLNSDANEYGGSNMGNLGGMETVPVPLHGRPYSLTITLPPLSVSFLSTKDKEKTGGCRKSKRLSLTCP